MNRHLFHGLNARLNKPSNIYTVGQDKCDYTSLVTALENGAEGDTFIVFGGTHNGKLNLRKNQSIHCIGKVILKQTANDYLFFLHLPSDYNASNPSLYEIFWSGSLPFLQFYSNTKWISLENNFLATIDMKELYLHHLISFSSSGAGPLVLNSITSNLVVSSSWFTPEHSDTGLYNFQIFTDQGLAPKVDKQILLLQCISANRILICDHELESFYANINSFDFNAAPAETCAGSIECKIPFYFENL
jgi:hypothetical protein